MLGLQQLGNHPVQRLVCRRHCRPARRTGCRLDRCDAAARDPATGACSPDSGCVAGTPPDPDDNIVCTVDVCDEETDSLLNTIGAAGDVSIDDAASKLSDATINLLNTVGYFRFNCTSQSRFVKNVKNVWTSKKFNGESWSMDRNKDLNFECAANRAGYVLSDYPACAAGHLNYVAVNGFPEGGGCYHDGSGWNQNGSLWAK